MYTRDYNNNDCNDEVRAEFVVSSSRAIMVIWRVFESARLRQGLQGHGGAIASILL